MRKLTMTFDWLKSLSPEMPVLIAGPTASGKSALALEIAARHGGVIVNADALQVFGNWRVLTARPSPQEEKQAKHALYGHVSKEKTYSVGHWLRDLEPLLMGPDRPIIVGGTGLYFIALTEGLATIPPTPDKVRADADARVAADGAHSLLAEIDVETRTRIDTMNPVRIQRAWEVQMATGRGVAAWQDETPQPRAPLSDTNAIVLNAEKEWLTDRIGRRFDLMIEQGALDEAKDNLADWDPKRPSSKAIGAPELIDHLQGNRDLKDAVAAGKIATRQYAKRQRTWFRSKMKSWRPILLP